MTVYAINNRTKEHVKADRYEPVYAMGDWRIVETDADGWIPWSGGECPLPDGHETEIRFFSGDISRVDDPQRLHWAQDGSYVDIIAYRPILSDDEGEQPEWNGEGLPPVGCVVAYEGNRVEVVAHDHKEDQFCARHEDGQLSILRPWWVRPIRSDEDRAVEEMYDIASEVNRFTDKQVLRELYRAGYRKQ